MLIGDCLNASGQGPGGFVYLALFLTMPGSHLNGRRVLQWSAPLHVLLDVWAYAKHSDAQRALRIRCCVEQFLYKSG